jgi:bifunctional non-homologous end joining protein LigD
MNALIDGAIGTKYIANLYFQEGTSDKVYHAAVHKVKGGFNVFYAYGRRDGNLAQGYKSEVPYPDMEQAIKVFNKLVTEKTKKGYQNA